MSGYDVFDPFLTVFRELERNGDPRNPQSEARALAIREELTQQLLQGDGYLDSSLDCLAEQGINPDQWLETVESNIEYVIDAGVRFTSNHHGILLPDSYYARF